MSARTSKAPVAIPEKRSYTNKEFVSRKRELAEIAQRVKQGKSGANIDLPVLNFWGIEGSGKSWLLHHIAQSYQGPGRLRQGECKRTFTILLDLDGFEKFEWTPENLAKLLRPVAENIPAQLSDAIQGFSALSAGIKDVAAVAKTPDDLSRIFVDWLISLTEQYVPLVLFDTIEHATSEALAQIELNLIEPLASTDKIIVVTAGRREVANWHRFAIRRRQGESLELGPLTSKDTINQVQKQGFGSTSKTVYEYSFGLAYASQIMATALQSHHYPPAVWLGVLVEHFLSDIAPELRNILRTLCVMRVIREGILPVLLSGIEEEEYRLLFDKLESTRLLWWNPQQGAYVIASPLRRMLSLELKIAKPRTFAQRHRKVADYYYKQISDKPYDCGLLLIEALYHTAYGYTAPSSQITNLLKQALRADNFTVGGVEFLIRQIENDEEFCEALKANDLNHVLKSVQTLRRDVRRKRLSIQAN